MRASSFFLAGFWMFIVRSSLWKTLFTDASCRLPSKKACSYYSKRAVLPAPPLAMSASIAWLPFFSSESSARKSPPKGSRNLKKKKIGAGDVVEVDECYTSGGKGGRKVARQGRGLAGKIAFAGAIERHGRRVRIERIESASRKNLTSFIVRNVRRGATVHTDSFKSYLDVPKYGYTHCRVNHFLTFKDRKSGACTNMIESVWSQMLCHWERFRGGFRNNLDLWIAEIEFRIENNKNLPSALKRVLRKKWNILILS